MNSLGPSEAMIHMDFKMKYNPMLYREKTNQFYDKKGISWHGSLVHMRHVAQTSDERVEDYESFDLFYYAHILLGDTTQDMGAVLFIFEALLWRLKQQHPHIIGIYL